MWFNFFQITDYFLINKRPLGHIAHLRKQFKPLYHNVHSENREKTLWEFIGSSFEQTWIPFTQGCFVPRLVEIGPVVLEKKILHIFTISKLSPLGKGQGLSFEKIWIPFTQGSWEEVENRKSLQTERQTDAGWKAIRKAHLSFQLRWAKKMGFQVIYKGCSICNVYCMVPQNNLSK